MKKLFFILCMSSLALTGCFVKSPSSRVGESDREIVHNFCTENPGNQLCVAIYGKTEMTLQDVKPVMRLTRDSKEPLYGASNPDEWKKGYFNLPRLHEDGGSVLYMVNFSVESGSALTVGMPFNRWILNVNAGTTTSNAMSVVSSVGGGAWSGHTNINTWGPVSIRVVVSQDLGAYFFLPTMRFAD